MFQGLYDGLPSLPGEQQPQAPTDATAVSSTKSVDGTSKVADEPSAQPISGEKKAGSLSPQILFLFTIVLKCLMAYIFR